MNKIKSRYATTKPTPSAKTSSIMAEIQSRLNRVVTHLNQQDEDTRNRLLGFNRIRAIYEAVANDDETLTFDKLAAIINDIDTPNSGNDAAMPQLFAKTGEKIIF